MPNEKTYEQVREEWVDSQESTKKVLELRKKGFKLQDKIQRDIKKHLYEIQKWYFVSSLIESKAHEAAYEIPNPDDPASEKIHDIISSLTNECPISWLETYGELVHDVDQLAIDTCSSVTKLQKELKSLSKTQEDNWEVYCAECVRLREVYDANQKEEAARQVQEADT